MKITISGATGLLGFHTAKYLLQQGHTIYALGRKTERGKNLTSLGAIFIKSSLDEIDKYQDAIKDSDVVIHSAALSTPWGKRADFEKTNIQGTQYIVDLCIKYSVSKLIYISTPSLYFKFKDELNISENTKITPPFPSEYTRSKYYAEKIIERANKQGLFTIILRPRGIFGPGDEALLPRLINAAGNKGLPQFGAGDNVIDITYVDNVVHAIEQSINSDKSCNGEIYNITNGEPIKLWSFLKSLFQKLDIKNQERKIPYFIIFYTAWFLEIFYRLLKPKHEPPLTRYTVGLLSKSQTLNIEKAKNELKYDPKVSMQEGVDEVIKWWKNDKSNG